jgi:MFS family permease
VTAAKTLRKAVSRHLRAAAGVFAGAARNAALRTLAFALVGSGGAEGVYAVGIAVFAYERGGAAAVGLVTLWRMLLAAAATPFASVLGDRLRRERVMLVTDAVRTATLAVMGVAVALDAPALVVYGLAGLLAVVSTAFWPAQAALLPSLARTPGELTAGNVMTSSVEGLGSFIGPAVGGVVLIAGGAAAVFFAAAVGFLLSTLSIARLPGSDARPAAVAKARVSDELVEGFRVVAVEPRARLLVGLFAAQMLVAGALNVLVVVSAFQLLDAGQSGVGYLGSAVGFGGVLGLVGGAALVGSRRLAEAFGLGLVLWGLPLAVIGVWPSEGAALVLLVLAGTGYTVTDVAGFTLLQRVVDDAVLARVFGTLESLALAATGAGALLAPLLIDGLGVRGALGATGAFVPLVMLVAWRSLRAVDPGAAVPVELLDLLRSAPIFAELPQPALERVAARTAVESHDAGATIFRQGDRGDRFYVIEDGSVEIDVDGASVRILGPRDFFGEIGLLRDVPRTATAVAWTPVRLVAVDGPAFVAAVTGHTPSARAAEHVVAARLQFRTPGGALA